MKMMKAAVALGMALTMTVTGASAVFAEGETLSVATDFEIKTLVPWAASEENAFLVLNQAEEGLFRMDENSLSRLFAILMRYPMTSLHTPST